MESKIRKAELAREKCQTNVFKQTWETKLRKKEEILVKKEQQLKKKEELTK